MTRTIPSPPSLSLCAFDPAHALAAEVSWKAPGTAFVVSREAVTDALVEAGLPASYVPTRGATSIFTSFMRSRRAARILTLDADTKLRRSLKIERNFKRTENGIERVIFTLHTVEGTGEGEEVLGEVGALLWAFDKDTEQWTLDFEPCEGFDELPGLTKQWASEVRDDAEAYVKAREGEVDNELVQQMLSAFFARERDAVSHAAATWVIAHRAEPGAGMTAAERAVALANVVDATTPFRVFAKSVFPHPADIRQAAWAALDSLNSEITSVSEEVASYADRNKMKGEKRFAEKVAKIDQLRERTRAIERVFVERLATARQDLEAAATDLSKAQAVEVARLETYFEGILEAFDQDIDAVADVLANGEKTPEPAPEPEPEIEPTVVVDENLVTGPEAILAGAVLEAFNASPAKAVFDAFGDAGGPLLVPADDEYDDSPTVPTPPKAAVAEPEPAPAPKAPEDDLEWF